MSKGQVTQGLARRNVGADQLTVLTALPGYLAAKRFVGGPEGVKVIPYNAGKIFAVCQFPLRGIQDLSDALTILEREPTSFVVRGEPIDLSCERLVFRRSGGDCAAFTSSAPGRCWLILDFDKVTRPAALAQKRGGAVADSEYLVSLLPKEFHNASYHWQLSSSAGIGANELIKLHLAFWLDQPATDQELKAWAKVINKRAGYALVDAALFQAVQAHYTAAPLFEGMTDPVKQRSGLVHKTEASVCLDLSIAAPKSRLQAGDKRSSKGAPASRTGTSAPGFEAKLTAIGDHPGGRGFRKAILEAAASYVAKHGRDGTDASALKQRLRARIFTAVADPTEHDSDYLAFMASEANLDSAIQSALVKFGDHPTRKKSSLHAGLAPHFQASTVSATEASRLLAQIARDLC